MGKIYDKSLKFKNACHLIAEHVRKVEIDEDLYEEMKFIRFNMIDFLSCEAIQEDLYVDFESEAELQNNQGF
tara:strand:+ start:1271 stop:1486 length:216 start_codon:yes stop_codon:yes gene_type:complete